MTSGGELGLFFEIALESLGVRRVVQLGLFCEISGEPVEVGELGLFFRTG